MFRSCILMIALLLVPVFFPGNGSGDGGYIPTVDVDIFEPGQNAVIAWEGQTERLYLSVNIYGEEGTDGFHVVPFPAEPEISLGDISIFDKLDELVQEDWDFRDTQDYGYAPMSAGDGNEEKDPVVVTQRKQIGNHDITVIKVIDPDDFKDKLMDIVDDAGIDLDTWPEDLTDVIENYTRKGIDHFSIDHYGISSSEASMKPVVYEFDSDTVFFPLEISSILDAGTRVNLGIVHPDNIELEMTCFRNSVIKTYIMKHLTEGDVKDLDEEIHELVGADARLTFIQFETNLRGLKGDVVLPAADMVSGWMDPEEFTYSSWPSRAGFPIYGTDYAFIFESTRDARFICVDGREHDVKWSGDLEGEYRNRGHTLLEVNGFQGVYHPVILEVADHHPDRFRRLSRWDPATGDMIWSRMIDSGSENPLEFRTLRDPDGIDHILFGDDSRMVLIDMGTGAIEKEYGQFWNLRHHPYHIFPTKSGDLIVFNENYGDHSYLFDPFADGLPATYPSRRNSTPSYELEDLVISEFPTTMIHVFEHNQTLLGMTYSNVTGRNLYDLWDLYSGEHMGLLNLSFMGGIYGVPYGGDIDKDGEDEVLFLHSGTLMDEGLFAMSIDLATMDVEYDVQVLQSYHWEIGWKFIDFGGDGDLDLLVKDGYYSQNGIRNIYGGILDMWNGSVIFKGKLGRDPFERVAEGSVVDSIVVRTLDGRLAVFDYDDGLSKPFDLDLSNDFPYLEDHGYIEYLDLDGDGTREIIIFHNNLFGEIFWMDPAGGTKVTRECVYGYSRPLVAVGSGTGASILMFSKNSFLWIGDSPDPEEGPVEVLQMDQTNVDIRSNTEVDDDDGDIGPIDIEDDALPFLIGVGILLLIVIIMVLLLIGILIIKAVKRSNLDEE